MRELSQAGSAPGASVPGLHFPDLQLQSPLLAGDHAKLHADTSPPPAATQSIEWARQLPNEDVQMASLPAGGHARAGEAQSVGHCCQIDAASVLTHFWWSLVHPQSTMHSKPEQLVNDAFLILTELLFTCHLPGLLRSAMNQTSNVFILTGLCCCRCPCVIGGPCLAS